jgi:hypothetical protein
MLMSQEVGTNRSGVRMIALYVVAPVIGLATVVVLILLGGPGKVKPPDNPNKTTEQENLLALVRTTLAKQDDLPTCKTVVSQLNSQLRKAEGKGPPPLSTPQREVLSMEMGASKDDLAEAGSSTFTPLDAHYLADCFLMRDAARSLELATPAGRGSKVKQTPLDRAELAFAWVVRQVRLYQPPRPEGTGMPEPEPVPPGFVLRRGWGSALERGLVFLAVLEQFGLDEKADKDHKPGRKELQSALLFCPDSSGGKRFWACGVAVVDDPKTLYLFDPRLGLPIPGPGGKGVATLAQVRDDARVFEQLTVDKLRYDVTPEQVKAVEVQVVCPISAVAPRMRFLQDRLLRDPTWNGQPLPAQVRVRLAEEVREGKDGLGALAPLRAAVKASGGTAEQVKVWRPGTAILRRFLPKDEGGSDTTGLYVRRAFDLAPWQDLHPFFLGPSFKPDQALGRDLRWRFVSPFLEQLAKPNSPRDLILRGRFTKAAPELVKDQEYWQQMRRRFLAGVERQPMEEWREKAVHAYAEELRARGTPNEAAAKAGIAEVWRWTVGSPMEVLLYGSAAEARGAEATYQLGLCKHELAARLQARKELAARGGVATPADTRKADDAWKDAEGYWNEYIETYPRRPGQAAARRLRGEALARRGQVKEAIAAWQDTRAPMTDLEKLANAWLVKQLREQTKKA